MHDAELIRDLIDEEKFSVKQISRVSGYGESAIYKMLSGDRAVTTTLLQAAWRMTGDTRILGLLISGSGWAVQLVPINPPVAQGKLAELLPRALDALRDATDCVEYLHKIGADGRVDRYDDADISAFDKHEADVQKIFAGIGGALHALRAAEGSR